MKKKANEQNLLDLIPEQICNFEKNEDGLISVIKPKFHNRIFVKYLAPRLKRPFFRVKLDEFGTSIWELCNGKNTVGAIGEQLHQQFYQPLHPHDL